MSCDCIEEIRLASNQDDVMQEAFKCIIEEWLQHPKDVLIHTWLDCMHKRSHLSVPDRLFIFDGRIVIPQSLHA